MEHGNSIGLPSMLASIALLSGVSALDAPAQTVEIPSAHVPVTPAQPEKGGVGVEERSVEVAADQYGPGTPRCMRQTGSKVRSRGCTGARGRAHDRDDQEATGRMDAGTRVHANETGAQILNRLND